METKTKAITAIKELKNLFIGDTQEHKHLSLIEDILADIDEPCSLFKDEQNIVDMGADKIQSIQRIFAEFEGENCFNAFRNLLVKFENRADKAEQEHKAMKYSHIPVSEEDSF